MKFDKNNIVRRIDELLKDNEKIIDANTVYSAKVEQVVFGTLSIINICYSEKSAQYKALLELRDRFIKGGSGWIFSNTYEIKTFYYRNFKCTKN